MTVKSIAVAALRGILLVLMATVSNLSGGGIANAADEQDLHTEMVAITVGSRVLLSPDGTWEPEYEIEGKAFEAVTLNGRSVELMETTKNGKETRTWKYSGRSPGVIQVVIARAVNTNKSLHSTDDNCAPVIAVRNLTQTNLAQIVIEAVFHSGEHFDARTGIHGSMSVMVGRVVHGEEHERDGPPLFVPDCKGLRGTVTIPYCRLENGVRCEQLVDASRFGVIPLEMGRDGKDDDHLKN